VSSPSSPSAEQPPTRARSPFQLNPQLLCFDPAAFASHHALVAALYRAGVAAVAELGETSPGRGHLDLKEQVKQFGVAWVTLGPISERSVRRLAVGCHRFKVAIAAADLAGVQRQLGAHPLFRQMRTAPLQ
jgi:hypothetical protein